ncbi:MAG: class I SAM-dependent methyltransferase [Gammaproteobacteria bacterium]|nr:class I SAM-dependent methyltransferase [Gammaproteobacteria bacterium]
METQQKLQEEEYQYPYHYIPVCEDELFHQHRYWAWGFRYLGGLKLVTDLCEKQSAESLLDLGCGDGRFLSEIYQRWEDKRLLGVDYSERAIALANALNPEIEYKAVDILSDQLDETFDIVTLIEVIEHIRPEHLELFIQRVVSCIKPKGRLVLTVPHINKKVSKKHFQHFDSSKLYELLSPYFEELQFYPFDRSNRILKWWFRLIGGHGRYYLITWPWLLSAFYRYYLSTCLYGIEEAECERIACVARRK